MSFTQKTLSIHVYAPTLVDNDIRPVAVVHAMERAVPGLLLEWTVSDDHQLRPLPQRDAWLARAIRNGGFPMVCNNDESHPVTIFGVAESARFGPGGQSLVEIHAELPLETSVLTVAADILEGIAEGARAFWGHATPFDASAEISRQTRDPMRKPGEAPRGLPALKTPENIRSPAIPHRLGWLNYWSAAAARAIGFPAPTRGAEMLSYSRRTETSGWVVRLTNEPLNLDNPEHMDALKRAYEHFPEIGGRMAAEPGPLLGSRSKEEG